MKRSIAAFTIGIVGAVGTYYALSPSPQGPEPFEGQHQYSVASVPGPDLMVERHAAILRDWYVFSNRMGGVHPSFDGHGVVWFNSLVEVAKFQNGGGQ